MNCHVVCIAESSESEGSAEFSTRFFYVVQISFISLKKMNLGCFLDILIHGSFV